MKRTRLQTRSTKQKGTLSSEKTIGIVWFKYNQVELWF